MVLFGDLWFVRIRVDVRCSSIRSLDELGYKKTNARCNARGIPATVATSNPKRSSDCLFQHVMHVNAFHALHLHLKWPKFPLNTRTCITYMCPQPQMKFYNFNVGHTASLDRACEKRKHDHMTAARALSDQSAQVELRWFPHQQQASEP